MKTPVCVLVALALASPALGVTFVVNDTADVHDGNPGNGVCQTASPGICTLRAAMDEANATSGATIQLPAGTFTLTLGPLPVQTPTTIVGAGAGVSIVSGNNLSPVFNVTSTAATFQRLMIRDGNAATGTGGGINTVFSTLVVDSCVITHSYALYGGGGIAMSGEVNVTLTNTSITDCHALGVTAVGGALYVDGPGTATGCTFSGNSAASGGGAVYQSGGTFDLVNCTLSDNSATVGGGLVAGPDAIFGLYNATVAYNIGTAQGGGISNGGTLTIANSIVAGNGHPSGLIFVNDDCVGTIDSNGSNIVLAIDAGHCIVNGATSSSIPSFGSLRDNGGLTKTHALLAASPGLDAVDGCTTRLGAALTTDQRGVARPIGAKCDLGAYERAPCGDANGDGSVNVADVFTVITGLFAGGPVPPGLANVNGDSTLNVSDVFYMINALFAGGPAPNCPGA